MALRKLLYLDTDNEMRWVDATADSIAIGSATFTDPITIADGTLSSHAASKGQLDALAATLGEFVWLAGVASRLDTPPGSPSTGDRYLVIATATGAWAGHEDDIAEWNGSAWVFTSPNTGEWVDVEDEANFVYQYNGAAWVQKSWEQTTASLGCVKSGYDIRLSLLASGGLKLTGNDVGVEPADFAGLGLEDDGSDNLQLKLDAVGGANLAKVISRVTNGVSIKIDDSSIEENGSGQLGVKADGINDTHIDWGTGANQVSGVDVPLADAGGYFTTDNVEAALQQLAADTGGLSATSDASGISKGDIVYFSANDVLSSYDDTSIIRNIAGAALETVGASAAVKYAMSNQIITGVLSGATFNAKQYWTGVGYSETAPTGTLKKLIIGGIAKNATDLNLDIRRVGVFS
jgi:hypothetical protein